MSLPERGIEALGPNRKNLLWLPPLTLGYIYHLSGVRKFFLWGVVSCAGAMTLHDWTTELLGPDTREINKPTAQQIYGTIPDSLGKRWLLAGVLLSYLYATILSINTLQEYFTSNDLILVGFSFAYLGGLLTWILNGEFLLRSLSEHGEAELKELHPNIPGPMATILESSVGLVSEPEESTDQIDEQSEED